MSWKERKKSERRRKRQKLSLKSPNNAAVASAAGTTTNTPVAAAPAATTPTEESAKPIETPATTASKEGATTAVSKEVADTSKPEGYLTAVETVAKSTTSGIQGIMEAMAFVDSAYVANQSGFPPISVINAMDICKISPEEVNGMIAKINLNSRSNEEANKNKQAILVQIINNGKKKTAQVIDHLVAAAEKASTVEDAQKYVTALKSKGALHYLTS